MQFGSIAFITACKGSIMSEPLFSTSATFAKTLSPAIISSWVIVTAQRDWADFGDVDSGRETLEGGVTTLLSTEKLFIRKNSKIVITSIREVICGRKVLPLLSPLPLFLLDKRRMG
jgi:hypothetical protein